MMTNMQTVPIFIVSLFVHFSLTIARDTITLATPLADGETLVSAGGSFVLGFFTPANSHNRYVGLWFNQISVQTILWVANRQHPVPDTTGTLKLTSDGNLIITNQNSTIFWSSATSSVTTPVAKLLGNGNLVVREANAITNGSFAWQSFDHPTDSLLPGMKLGVDLRTGLNRNLTAWKSESDPSPGDYVMSMDILGDPQLTAWAGTARKWRSGSWNGEAFTGMPEMKTFHEFNFHFFNTKDEIYYSYETTDKSIITRMVMNHTGATQLFVWLDGSVWLGGSDGWGLFWYAPKTKCNGFSLCGSYGFCSIYTSQMLA
ncbi:hypothetical protein J5N97_011771 [Dioscorea zingiberensis]|uniref:Bulb-type lectin domain-containing protein n=1 Tax=Dioscorea zingiberensis TaxID=325984 RepID=A0A9D5D1N5_9LILI|nr:hypothetical protein J5N97_011771 [Dioscorea zingiberensis]